MVVAVVAVMVIVEVKVKVMVVVVAVKVEAEMVEMVVEVEEVGTMQVGMSVGEHMTALVGHHDHHSSLARKH